MKDSRSCTKQMEEEAKSGRSSCEPIRIQELMERIGGDLDLLSHLLTIFTRDYDQCITSVQQAIKDKDGEALHKLAHRMKGALGNFAAHGAYEAAQRLEKMALGDDLSKAEALWEQLQGEVRKVKVTLESLVKGEIDCP